MVKSLLNEHHFEKAKSHYMAMAYLTSKQCLKIKSLMMNTNNCLNKVFSTFDSLNKELSLSFGLTDNFSDCFSFYSANWKDTDIIIAYWNKLNSIYKDSLIN